MIVSGETWQARLPMVYLSECLAGVGAQVLYYQFSQVCFDDLPNFIGLLPLMQATAWYDGCTVVTIVVQGLANDTIKVPSSEIA